MINVVQIKGLMISSPNTSYKLKKSKLLARKKLEIIKDIEKFKIY